MPLRKYLFVNHLFGFFLKGVRSDPELRGVIPNSFDHIFKHIARTHDQQYLVRASYLEIYQVDYYINFVEVYEWYKVQEEQFRTDRAVQYK